MHLWKYTTIVWFLICFLFPDYLSAQTFYTGADLSYVNEMEDCGVEYKVQMENRDPFTVFMEHGCNLVRFRLWHTPNWYDSLNNRQRYSDLHDVARSISRAKENNMEVLLDFHLSDNWADPSKQLVPEAWKRVVDDTGVLADSIYNYIFNTLEYLNDRDLLPEFVQVGNETNKGIVLSEEDNRKWTLDWERNARLFNSGIKAVRDASKKAKKDIQIILHVAAPENTAWMIEGFMEHGVQDFDIIGISYYWAWHKPTEIDETAKIISELKAWYDKEVMIVETGYIWTTAHNDEAPNIISEVHPEYSPASPENQRDWLIDMTKAVKTAGCLGVLYWEPAWVSSDCYTQWGKGSHQEHACFFDFNTNLIKPGGIEWMEKDYSDIPIDPDKYPISGFLFLKNAFSGELIVKVRDISGQTLKVMVARSTGEQLISEKLTLESWKTSLKKEGFDDYMIKILDTNDRELARSGFHYFGN